MANVLDLRRRIRSVKNTRQITKAMKMVSAASCAARRSAPGGAAVCADAGQRLEVAGGARRDLRPGDWRAAASAADRARREERLLIVVTGDKGFAGAFNANILKAAMRFIDDKARTRTIDIEPIGRKARDYFRRRFPQAHEQTARSATPDARVGSTRRSRWMLLGEHRLRQARELAERVIKRYINEEIDAVYLVYNEFKSVISQRVVVERMLADRRDRQRRFRQADEMT